MIGFSWQNTFPYLPLLTFSKLYPTLFFLPMEPYWTFTFLCLKALVQYRKAKQAKKGSQKQTGRSTITGHSTRISSKLFLQLPGSRTEWLYWAHFTMAPAERHQTGCKTWSLRHQEHDCKQPQASCSNVDISPAWSRGMGLNDFLKSLPT